MFSWSGVHANVEHHRTAEACGLRSRVEVRGSTERLIQETTFEGVSFTRTFELVEDVTTSSKGKAPLL